MDYVTDVRDTAGAIRERHAGAPLVLVGHSMGGLIATRYAQRHREELTGLVLSAPAIGLGPVFAQWLDAGEPPSDPIDVAVLSRDPAVGEAYANDPLVWHGGWKRPTVAAFHRASVAVDSGPGFDDLPVLYVHGAADELVPMILVRPVVERLRGTDHSERIVPEARHEVFNETDKDETVREMADFVERVTPRT
jgi:alpha-beta hydrolase superfamily lysophospholipase